VLPLQLISSFNSLENKPGQIIKARIMQDVPLTGRSHIRGGAKVLGRVEMVRPRPMDGPLRSRFASKRSTLPTGPSPSARASGRWLR
jgi:hypothetical protein